MYTNLSELSTVAQIIMRGSQPEINRLSPDLPGTEITPDIETLIIRNARRNGLLPLLYKNIRTSYRVPDSFMERLKQHVLKLSMVQLKQELIFREATDLLGHRQIDFRVLKGLYLANAVYKEALWRPMMDIDLLIHPAQINEAFELFKSNGFISFPVAESTVISKQKHHPYGLRKNGVIIELHKSIFDDHEPARIPDEVLWENPVEFTASTKLVKTLSTEVFLFHLCHHLMGHLRGDFIKLIWCRDIAEFTGKFHADIDWDYFLQLYRSSGAGEEFLHALWFAHDWMLADIPEKVLSSIKTPPARIAEKFIWFAGHERNDIPRPHLIAKFNRLKGWHDKTLFMLAKLFPDSEFLLLQNRKKSKLNLFLLYPKHIGKFFYRGFRAILKR